MAVRPTPFFPFSPNGGSLQSTVMHSLPFVWEGQELILSIHKLFLLFETQMHMLMQKHEKT